MIVDGHAHCAHLAAGLQILKGAAPLVAREPFGVPDVQLLQVDGVQLQVAQALFGAADDVVVREHAFNADARLRWPHQILGRHFRGDVDALLGLVNDLANQLLAVPVAISQRRVDEVDPQLDGPVQCAYRLVVGATPPLGAANAPGSVAYLAHLKACPSQRP